MSFKRFFIILLCLTLAGLIALGSVTAVIDPFFHYHAPLEGLEYEIFYQRYQNDGILRHFDYDAMITGNSLCENFSASLCDALFGVKSVKVPFSGASSKELDQNIRTAIRARGEGLRLVIAGVDYSNLVKDKDYMYYEAKDYPSFLYDNNPINDVKYLLNKSIMKYSADVISYTLAGNKTTSFDAYSNWDSPEQSVFGREAALATYERQWDSGLCFEMNEEYQALLMGNLQQNFIDTISANPQIDFYLFFPPYSILYWDKIDRNGSLHLQLEAEKMAIETLLEYENVHLFSFLDEFELICDLERYKDYIHYDSAVNDWMLECMAAGEHQLTKDNYIGYCERISGFYTTYDYDAIFE